MSATPQAKKKITFNSTHFSPALQENHILQNDLPRSTNIFLCLVLERLEQLVNLAKETEEEKIKESVDLDALLEHLIKFMELPVSRAGMANVNKQIDRIIQENNFRKRRQEDFEQLTQREKEVLALLALGNINKEVADKLCVSLETVKHYRKIIKSKLCITSVADIVQFAQAFNLV